MSNPDKTIRFFLSCHQEIERLILIGLDAARDNYVEFIDIIGIVVREWFKELPRKQQTAEVFNEIPLYVSYILDKLVLSSQVETRCAMQPVEYQALSMESVYAYGVFGERKGFLRKVFGSIYESQGQ